MSGIQMDPIGIVRSSRIQPLDDHWDKETTRIEIDGSRFTSEAFVGLDAFSHVEVIFVMDRVNAAESTMGARRPRGNLDWPEVGIFAQRAKSRVNRIGLTICRVLRLEGLTIHVEGLDAIDGSPILDIKPWVQEFGPRGEVRQPDWMTELMREYW